MGQKLDCIFVVSNLSIRIYNKKKDRAFEVPHCRRKIIVVLYTFAKRLTRQHRVEASSESTKRVKD